MTRIAVTADLHLGITSPEALADLAREIATAKPDALVLAGDIAEHGRWAECLAIFDEQLDLPPARKAALPGNHDLWCWGGHSSRSLFDEILPETTRQQGWTWLETDTIRIGALAIVGSIAWYDYAAAAHLGISLDALRAYKPHVDADGRRMDPEWDDIAFAFDRRESVLLRLDALEADPDIESIMLITHVPLMHEQHIPHPEDDIRANAYSHHWSLGDLAIAMPKLRAVVSGHTHRSIDMERDRDKIIPVRIITVPSDYTQPTWALLEYPS